MYNSLSKLLNAEFYKYTLRQQISRLLC